MPTFYLVTDKTKNRNRIIKRCKILDSFLITVFFDNTICHLLPIFTKFCMQLGPSCRLPTASPGRWIGGRPPDMVASCDLSG